MFKYRSGVKKCDSPCDRVQSSRESQKLSEKVYDTEFYHLKNTKQSLFLVFSVNRKAQKLL